MTDDLTANKETAVRFLDAVTAGDVGAFGAAFTALVQFAEVGQGTLDWPAILEQAIEGGAQYLFVEQDDTYGRDPFDCIADSRAYLKSIGY